MIPLQMLNKQLVMQVFLPDMSNKTKQQALQSLSDPANRVVYIFTLTIAPSK